MDHPQLKRRHPGPNSCRYAKLALSPGTIRSGLVLAPGLQRTGSISLVGRGPCNQPSQLSVAVVVRLTMRPPPLPALASQGPNLEGAACHGMG